ncbi:hypothetical protein JX265_001156 [Neoarthrinium moseri]|uniref:Velvet domain-containing protein n=1 Tax=Neoarthrinium moseri TaxID=1658444 RepID=A0A9Q0AVM1_9PEZI|nr:uncharacterized protein JN550_007330 [Neoarthrinium moseri]KAI1848826.1 hypothetical protein JX266_005254 [Neoarthrinium moseri]KAI1866783.1 hypothetical protein JN550_007330 [Neoarthrinium moseri]KAI1880916.1 hypothetical protein JX265_001156 [Neoarthrinium moseri]
MNYPLHQGSWGPMQQQNTYSRQDHIQAPQAVPMRSRYDGYILRVIQNPKHGRVGIGKEKDRKPLDPPPFVQLDVLDRPDHTMHLQSPYLLVYAYLEPASSTAISAEERKKVGSHLMGTTASSLHRLKDMKNLDVAAFVFPDLTVKAEGQYVIRFVLMNLEEDAGISGEWVTICETVSEPFTVHSARTFPGMAESTPLTRMFADQGVRVRLRKDSRQLTTKKQNNNLAEKIGTKRGRNVHDHAEMEPHRGSVASPDRSYFDTQQQYGDVQDGKRQRTASGANNAYQMRPSISTAMPYSTYPGLTSTPAHHASFMTAPQSQQALYAPSYPREFSAGIGMGLPRGGSTRLDTQVAPYQGDMFASPSGHHSPGNPYAYGNTTADASPSLQHTPSHSHVSYFQGDQQLPALNQALNSGATHVNTSPQAHSQSIHTPVSSTGSPIEQVYTHAASQYPGGYVTQANGSYDHGTLRANGISTPVTGDMPSDSMQGQFVPSHLIAVDSVGFPKANPGA